jgi:protein-S-isoprenylcysteine O-methyltransferase Ste14
VTTYQRIFGTGPRGIGLSAILLGVIWQLEGVIGLPRLTDDDTLRFAALAVGSLGAVAIALASVIAMPPQDRGTRLVTTGIYRHIRHPIYASMISSFTFGLAVYLNGWLYLAWAVLLHPLWHWNVRAEERMMAEHFPEYPAYANRTGRFLPRISARR